MSNDDLHRLGFKLKFAYSMTGLFLGLACILAGVVLGISGVAGHTSWTASALGLSTSMTDATPGVIVFVVGIFFVLITRFRVRTTTSGPGDVHRSADYRLDDRSPVERTDDAIQAADRVRGVESSGTSNESKGGGSSHGYKTTLDYKTFD
jgi:hypothetical protein